MQASPQQTIADTFRLSGTFSKQSDLNPSGLCPHCGVLATFESRWSGPMPEARVSMIPPHPDGVIGDIGICTSCQCLVFGAVEYFPNGARRSTFLWPCESWPDRAPPGLEASVKQSYDEARSILALSPAAASVLARRCLQTVLRDKLGIIKRTLNQEIEEAELRDEFSKPTRESLHLVREIGNLGAHLEFDTSNTLIEVTREQAQYTMETLEMVFDDLYVASTHAAEMRERIQKESVP